MERVKTIIIVVLLAAIAVLGWVMYNNDHTQLTSQTEEQSILPKEEISEEETEEVPQKPEYVDNGNVYYYLKAGESLDDNPQMILCYFDSGGDLRYYFRDASLVMQGLMDSEDHWDEFFEEGNGGEYSYNPSRSSSSKTVFSASWDGEPYMVQDPNIMPDINNMWAGTTWVTPHYGEHYIAISEDKGALIKWDERKDSDKPIDKVHYTRVKKAELMPQGVESDFLYE